MKLAGNSAQWANYPGMLFAQVKLTRPVYKLVIESNAWMVRSQTLMVAVINPCMSDDSCLGPL